MATTQIEPQPRLAPTVHAVLDRLRWQVRRYVWLEGLGIAVAWLGLAFWLSLAVDWLVEPPAAIRGIILAGVAAVLAGVLVRWIGRRAFVPLTDANMATVLERRFHQLDDCLLTSVVLAGRRPDEAGFNPEMLSHTCREAAERIGSVDLPTVFNPWPLRRALIAALVLTLTVAGFAVAAPAAFGTWARRSLLLENVLWPRTIRLVLEGFENGVAKVASGDDLEVFVLALPGDTPDPVAPRSVQVRYHIEGRPSERKTMQKVRAGRGNPDVLQRFSHTFRGVLAPIRFSVQGGDARVDNLQIQVVPSPTLEKEKMSLKLKYPKYLGRAEAELPVTAGVMQIPKGTQVAVHARANKELVQVRVQIAADEKGPGAPHVLEAQDLDADRRGLSYQLEEPLFRDTTLLFHLLDSDGIRSREPVRLALVAVPDAPPQLPVRLAGIGSAITPQARLPLAGRITDDYGIARAWFDYTIDQQKAGQMTIAEPKDRPVLLSLEDTALEARELKVAVGQKLMLSVKAQDLCDLEKAPNTGSSERWLLDVVTAEELSSLLEVRELVLRQRFETIVQEMTETRNLLLGLDFSMPAAKKDAKPGTKTAAKPGDKKAGDEPGEPAAEETTTPERQAALRTLRIQQAVQNCRKNAHETLGVAEGFDDIRQQLSNNRIGNNDWKNRLSGGIAEPLHKLFDQRFPELERRLDVLLAAVADTDLGPRRRELARAEADEILLVMRAVLGRMLELEDFKEVLENIRAIIKLQEDLGEETKQRHKQEIRNLLEK